MKALILVDLQNDFMPTGSLPVAGGLLAVDAANRTMPFFKEIIATKDWHPKNHIGFASKHPNRQPFSLVTLGDIEQMLWPDHCIQNTFGAELVASLNKERITFLVEKGQDKDIDSYSGFFDNARQRKTELHDYLRGKNVTDVYVMGVATDYCVKFTALDAVSLGFSTHVIFDGCHGIAEDKERLLDIKTELLDNGIKLPSMNSIASLMAP